MNDFYLILTSVLGAVGLSFVLKLDFRRIPTAALGSIIACGVFVWCFGVGGGLFVSSFVAAAVVSVFSEISARVLKAPVTVFLTPSLIPLVPGSYLYYTMYSIIERDFEGFVKNAINTIIIGFGVSVGVMLAAVGAKLFFSLVKKHKRK